MLYCRSDAFLLSGRHLFPNCRGLDCGWLWCCSVIFVPRCIRNMNTERRREHSPLLSPVLYNSLVPLVGLSVLVDLNLAAFGKMRFVLSAGFTVEYSFHIVHAFTTQKSRIEHSMHPCLVSSTICVACLAFTEFEFNEIYFFRSSLAIVMFVSYFQGCAIGCQSY